MSAAAIAHRRNAPPRIALVLLAVVVSATILLAACSGDASRDASRVAVDPCRLKGVEIELRCGSVVVPENRELAADPAARTIAIRFAVVPALARKPEPDAIFVFAGGPGQAATDVAGPLLALFAKLNRDHDVVLVDQRGTGGSHRLSCTDESGPGTFADAFDPAALDARIARCADRLGRDADLTQYTTSIAMRDVDAVRAALGYRRIDLWGASYGTRAALEYLRQFPEHVRTVTLDGVAPATLKLPLSFGVDTYATAVATIGACARDAECAARYPRLGDDFTALLTRLTAGPIDADVVHPASGVREHVALTRTGFASMIRTPLYTSLTASVVPLAVDRAARGDLDAFAAASSMVGAGLDETLAIGMHLSVVCAEDLLAIDDADLAAARAEAAKSVVDGRPNPLALVYVDQYRRLCAHWPARRPPAAYFASLRGRPGADVPTLMLSGGLDPATPPSYAETLSHTMTHARHVVAMNVGHGVSLQGCAPDLIERFVRGADATSLDVRCLTGMPRPPFALPVVETRPATALVAAP